VESPSNIPDLKIYTRDADTPIQVEYDSVDADTFDHTHPDDDPTGSKEIFLEINDHNEGIEEVEFTLTPRATPSTPTTHKGRIENDGQNKYIYLLINGLEAGIYDISYDVEFFNPTQNTG
jgi:hypothetical protein